MIMYFFSNICKMQIYYLIYILEWIFQRLTIETEVILSHLKDSIRLIDIFIRFTVR